MSRSVVLCLACIVPAAAAQSWGVWQPESTLPTNGVAKTHSIGLEVGGTIFVLGGPPWMNPESIEDGTVFSMPASGGPWTEEIGFDGYGGVLGQGGGVDNLGRIIIFGGDDPLNPGFDKPPFEWNQVEGPWHDHADRGPLAPATNFAYCTDDINRIYSLGGGPGENASISNPNSTYCERFIGSTDLWEPIAPMPIAMANAAASYDGLGHILVFGGVSPDGSARTNEVLQYDIAGNFWSSNANLNMPVALSDHQATLGADGRVYILGGSSGPIGNETVQQTVHVYDPVMNQWFIGPGMSEPRRNFASFLGSDDRVYVIGGENNFGGSNESESIYTTPCPVFVEQPIVFNDLWLNTTIALSAQVIGGGTISYQWQQDGIDLADGPSAGGGTIAGATTDSLNITSSGAADAGEYTLIATNNCGSVASTTSFISIRIPPTIPEYWTWTSLHPSYANHSYAYGVENGVQVGSAKFDTPDYLNLDHPTKWTGSALSGVNLTPAGGQGGNIVDFAGDKLVGWWWAPIQCYVNNQWQTCYFRRGARWDLAGNFYETNYSGFEYTSMNATDGISIVGSGATDDAVGNVFGKAVIWQAPAFEFAQSIHPSGYNDSSLSAVDGDRQFGTVNLPFAVVHAGMWEGTSGSFVDMHPAGYSNSTIVDASDDQQVGVVNMWNDPRAIIWTGSPDSFVDLNPDGATSSNATACESGLQIGTVTYPDGLPAHSGIWAGDKDSFVDLSGVVPEGYLGFNMSAIDVAPNGTIQIVGNSWNFDLSRAEAILITSSTQAPCSADLNDDGNLNFLDVSAFLSAFASSDPIADTNNDGLFNFLDVSRFLTDFSTGCP